MNNYQQSNTYERVYAQKFQVLLRSNKAPMHHLKQIAIKETEQYFREKAEKAAING